MSKKDENLCPECGFPLMDDSCTNDYCPHNANYDEDELDDEYLFDEDDDAF
jgi:hypothetical protein